MAQPSTALRPLALHLLDRPILTEASTPRGAVRVVLAAKQVLFVESVGHLDVPLATSLRDAIVAQLTAGARLRLFVEWTNLRSYESATRTLLTAMFMNDRQRFGEVLALTSAPLVAVGVSTAGVALALVGVDLSSTADAAVFTRRLRAAMDEAARG